MPMNDAVHNYLLKQVGDEDLLQEIYAEFLTSFRTGLDAFRAAMEDQNQERMRRAAHTLKGNAEDSYGYCRSFIYELALTCYEPALKAHHDRIRARLAAGRAAPAHLGADGLRRALADIRDAFYARPLADMAPDHRRALRELPQTLRSLAETLAKLKAARDETD